VEGRVAERKAMIDREHKLPIKRQAEVLSISRSTAYYKPRPVSEQDLLLMRKLDELHLNYPFAGSRMLRDLLRRQGFDVGRLHVGTLMKKMGIEAIYRRPNTSKPAPGHRIYPYLLRGLAVTRPNQVSRDGHQLYPDGAWVCLSCRRGGLVQPQDSELDSVDHNGRQLLP
jgi:putative transposase